MAHPGRWNEDMAVEIGEEELGADLGRVKANDAKVLGSDLLHPRMQNTAGLAQIGCGTTRGRASARSRSSHTTGLHKKG